MTQKTPKSTGWASTAAELAPVFAQLEKGDLVEFRRSMLYSHWAVYVGKDPAGVFKAVHMSDADDGNVTEASLKAAKSMSEVQEKYRIREVAITDIIKGGKGVRIYNRGDEYWQPLNPEEIVKRAKSAVGGSGAYDFSDKNCEHFVNWCRYDNAMSFQTDKLAIGLGCAAFGMVVAGAALFAVTYAKHKR